MIGLVKPHKGKCPYPPCGKDVTYRKLELLECPDCGTVYMRRPDGSLIPLGGINKASEPAVKEERKKLPERPLQPLPRERPRV